MPPTLPKACRSDVEELGQRHSERRRQRSRRGCRAAGIAHAGPAPAAASWTTARGAAAMRRNNTSQHSTTQHNTSHRSAAQHSTSHHSTARRTTAAPTPQQQHVPFVCRLCCILYIPPLHFPAGSHLTANPVQPAHPQRSSYISEQLIGTHRQSFVVPEASAGGHQKGERAGTGCGEGGGGRVDGLEGICGGGVEARPREGWPGALLCRLTAARLWRRGCAGGVMRACCVGGGAAPAGGRRRRAPTAGAAAGAEPSSSLPRWAERSARISTPHPRCAAQEMRQVGLERCRCAQAGLRPLRRGAASHAAAEGGGGGWRRRKAGRRAWRVPDLLRPSADYCGARV